MQTRFQIPTPTASPPGWCAFTSWQWDHITFMSATSTTGTGSPALPKKSSFSLIFLILVPEFLADHRWFFSGTPRFSWDQSNSILCAKVGNPSLNPFPKLPLVTAAPCDGAGETRQAPLYPGSIRRRQRSCRITVWLGNSPPSSTPCASATLTPAYSTIITIATRLLTAVSCSPLVSWSGGA